MKLRNIFLITAGLLCVTVACNRNLVHDTGESLQTLPVVDYNWKSVRVGGGGYVTGMVVHPLVEGVRYFRTDVGGAYRWEPATSEWIPMLDAVNTGEQVDGIALDANKPDRVYVALNDGVYRSDDRGRNWKKLFNASWSGNANLRWTGECLAVDPLNSAIIYAGTRKDGLWRSLDEGLTWMKVESIPAANVRAVTIDPNAQVNGRSATIYIGIPGGGIYKSGDGGDNFEALGGAPVFPNRMQVVAGSLYVTHSRGIGKLSEGVFQDVTPEGGVDRNYCGIAVDVNDPLKIVAAQRYSAFNNFIYRTTNGGDSWDLLSTSDLITKDPVVPWWPKDWFSSATSCLVFDPFHPGHLYFTDWFGVWFTPDVWTTGKVNFHTLEKGHEEVVVLTLAAPPAGPVLYSGVCDVFGFSHPDLTAFPSKRLYNISEGFSIAFCEERPENIAILGGKGNDGAITILATSTDCGETWTKRTLPDGVRLGKIVVSATDPDKMVYAAGTRSGNVYYSSDRGNSWSQAAGAPVGACGLGTADVWNKDFVLAADGKNGDAFYIFKDGYLYASSDGGANWEKRNSEPVPARGNYMFVQPAPGIEGEVWISLYANGLYRTSDGGRNIVKVDEFTSSTAFSWGAALQDSGDPVAYCYGIRSGVEGLHRSLDRGRSWQQISVGWSGFPAGVKAIAGDRQNFGRVYVGTGGRGIFYGQPSPGE